MTIIQQTMDIVPEIRVQENKSEKEARVGEVKNHREEYFHGADISMEAFCASLANAKIKLGRNAAFKWFRENGYISKQKSTWNMPLPKYVSQSLLSVKETFVFIADEQVAKYSPRITPKGRVYFTNKIISDFTERTVTAHKRYEKGSN